LVVAVHLIRFPIGAVERDWDLKFGMEEVPFGFLSSADVPLLERVLGAEFLGEIRVLAEVDKETLDILAWADGLPDMATEELDAQESELARLMAQFQNDRPCS